MALTDSEIEMVVRSRMEKVSKYAFPGHCFGCDKDNRPIIFMDTEAGICLCKTCWAAREIAKFKLFKPKLFAPKTVTPADVTVKSPEPAKIKIPFDLEDFLK